MKIFFILGVLLAIIPLIVLSDAARYILFDTTLIDWGKSTDMVGAMKCMMAFLFSVLSVGSFALYFESRD
jgi:hypothetical protein